MKLAPLDDTVASVMHIGHDVGGKYASNDPQFVGSMLSPPSRDRTYVHAGCVYLLLVCHHI